MSKFSTTSLTSFLFFVLISVPSRRISAASEILRKTDIEPFSTCFEIIPKLLGCLFGMPEISDIFEKKNFWKKPFSRQTFRELNLNFFEIILKLVYPGEWRTLLWSQDVTFSMFFETVLIWLFDIINCYLFIFKRSKSAGTSRKYFMVVGFESVLSLCTNSSLILFSFTPFRSHSRSKST